jgi:tight adherence protein B
VFDLASCCDCPQAVAAYRDPTGTLVLLVRGAVSVVAYRLMLRIARLAREGRVLR